MLLSLLTAASLLAPSSFLRAASGWRSHASVPMHFLVGTGPPGPYPASKRWEPLVHLPCCSSCSVNCTPNQVVTFVETSTCAKERGGAVAHCSPAHSLQQSRGSGIGLGWLVLLRVSPLQGLPARSRLYPNFPCAMTGLAVLQHLSLRWAAARLPGGLDQDSLTDFACSR